MESKLRKGVRFEDGVFTKFEEENEEETIPMAPGEPELDEPPKFQPFKLAPESATYANCSVVLHPGETW
jgi:hypothetical protein